MGDPMRIRARLDADVIDVRVLMAHEMETGQRKGGDGNLVPAWYINEVVASLNGTPVMKAHWGPAIAKNPYLAFKIAGGKAGDTVTISWTDNKGDSRTDEVKVK